MTASNADRHDQICKVLLNFTRFVYFTVFLNNLEITNVGLS